MEEMKRCRYCNAEINKAAKRCQFCNRWQRKSKIWIIILIVIIVILSIFVIICNNNIKKRSEAKNKLLLKSEKDVYSYLEETYPYDEFIVKDVDRTTKTDEDGAGKKQNIWSVYSKIIDKEFYVYTDYRFNCFIDALTKPNDDYEYVALEKYVSDFNDSRLRFKDKSQYTKYKSFCVVEAFITDFSSKEEMAQVVYNFIQYTSKKVPFVNYENENSIFFTFYNKEDTKYDRLIISDLDSLEDILKEIEDLHL